MSNDEDFRRLESKVDKLTDAVSKLILFEERQSTQGERIGAAEAKLAAHETGLSRIDRKVDQWINRGIGVWVAATALVAIVQLSSKFLK